MTTRFLVSNHDDTVSVLRILLQRSEEDLYVTVGLLADKKRSLKTTILFFCTTSDDLPCTNEASR